MRNLLVLLCAIACASTGCGDDGSGTDTDGGGGGGMDGGGGGGRDGEIIPTRDSPMGGFDSPGGGGCATGECPQCSDGIDNDGDGQADGMDIECTGPLDNDEGSFATGIPGDNRDPFWQDCFFDGNSGAGDDDCRYHTECITGERPLTDRGCQLSDMCIEFCAARSPNGCDCFGCCEVFLEDGTTVNILTGPGCSIADIDSCASCVQNDDCINECGTCELCPGRTADDLPAECYDVDGGTPMYTCEGGIPCMTTEDCPTDMAYFCSLGCCLSGPI